MRQAHQNVSDLKCLLKTLNFLTCGSFQEMRVTGLLVMSNMLKFKISNYMYFRYGFYSICLPCMNEFTIIYENRDS